MIFSYYIIIKKKIEKQNTFLLLSIHFETFLLRKAIRISNYFLMKRKKVNRNDPFPKRI